jgi:hypothetical protein
VAVTVHVSHGDVRDVAGVDEHHASASLREVVDGNVRRPVSVHVRGDELVATVVVEVGAGETKQREIVSE